MHYPVVHVPMPVTKIQSSVRLMCVQDQKSFFSFSCGQLDAAVYFFGLPIGQGVVTKDDVYEVNNKINVVFSREVWSHVVAIIYFWDATLKQDRLSLIFDKMAYQSSPTNHAFCSTHLMWWIPDSRHASGFLCRNSKLFNECMIYSSYIIKKILYY